MQTPAPYALPVPDMTWPRVGNHTLCQYRTCRSRRYRTCRSRRVGRYQHHTLGQYRTCRSIPEVSIRYVSTGHGVASRRRIGRGSRGRACRRRRKRSSCPCARQASTPGRKEGRKRKNERNKEEEKAHLHTAEHIAIREHRPDHLDLPRRAPVLPPKSFSPPPKVSAWQPKTDALHQGQHNCCRADLGRERAEADDALEGVGLLEVDGVVDLEAQFDPRPSDARPVLLAVKPRSNRARGLTAAARVGVVKWTVPRGQITRDLVKSVVGGRASVAQRV
eukprot:3933395-Rhodomonas_salina.6